MRTERRRSGPSTGAKVVASVLTMTLVAACGGDDVATDEGDDRFDLSGEQVRIGTAAEQALDMGTSYAIELLEGWGAEVEREELTDVSGLEAIIADRIDITARSSDEVIEGNVLDVPLVAIGSPSSVMHYALIGNPEVTDVAAMEGRTVANSGPGGFDTVLIDALLRDEGLDPESDVTPVPIGGSSERAAALVAEQADVAMVFMDNWFALEQQGADVALIGYVSDLLPGLSSRTLAATREFWDANEELATAIACANLEANAWIQTDREGFVDMVTDRVSGTDEEGVGAFHDAAIEQDLYPTEVDAVLSSDAYQATADLLLEGDLIDEQVDVTDWIDTSYLEAADDMGCGAD